MRTYRLQVWYFLSGKARTQHPSYCKFLLHIGKLRAMLKTKKHYCFNWTVYVCVLSSQDMWSVEKPCSSMSRDICRDWISLPNYEQCRYLFGSERSVYYFRICDNSENVSCCPSYFGWSGSCHVSDSFWKFLNVRFRFQKFPMSMTIKNRMTRRYHLCLKNMLQNSIGWEFNTSFKYFSLLR